MKNSMKKILLTVILLTVISFGINGQTYVSGGIYSNTVWTLANSPYIVTDTVVVFPGVTLTIQPGVVVKFDNNVRLEIRQATLLAQGTLTDSITFTSNSVTPFPGIWDAVCLNGVNANMTAYYCNFYYAAVGIYCCNNYYETVIVKHSNFKFNIIGLENDFGSNALIDTCNFSYNTDIGLVGDGNTLNYCHFSNNQNGIAGHANIIRNTRVESSSNVGIQPVAGSSVGSIIDNCVVVNNQYGIVSWGGEWPMGRILNSRIDSNSVAGIMLYGYLKGDTVFNCQITNNGIGILDTTCMGCYGGPDVIMNNIIENNGIGIRENTTLDTIFCNRICNSVSYNFYYNLDFNNNISIPSNYWCTSDSATVRAKIYDGYININKGLVHFMPIDTIGCYLYTCSALFNLYADTIIPHQYWAVNLASGVPPLTYLWSWGDGTTDTIALPSHIYSTAGYYNICLTITDSTGCTSMYCDSSYLSKNSDAMVYVNVITQTGIMVSSVNKSFLIFPNPASDYLTLRFAQNTSKAEIKIYNLLGELKSTSSKSSTESTIDISDLSNGVYIIEVTTDRNIMRKKFIKQ